MSLTTEQQRARRLLLLVIRPTLATLKLNGLAAEQLVLGTAIQESQLRWRRQLGGGPALGLWQCEPATHQDIWDNYLRYKRSLALRIWSLAPDPEPLRWDVPPRALRLVMDDAYACALCRIHYLRVPAPLPGADDLEAQAAYWKRWYNTPAGKGQPEEYREKWGRFVTPETFEPQAEDIA